MITSVISGKTTPPMIRSIELTLTVFVANVWIWVADVGRPSRSTPVALITHSFSPVRFQRPSPCPPSELNSQDLIWPD